MGYKKVLVLGAGMVAGPLIKYLLEKRIELTVACNNVDRANELIAKHQLAKVEFWEVGNEKLLNKLIHEHNVVVSLLPFNLHVQVAELCISNKKHLVTTSYVSKEMEMLNTEAKEAGITILCECGLDPGIDHMSAKRVIDTVHGLGGKVLKFYSVTGALPAPECSNDNPFRYKFSWSPKGVILAGNNNAEYLLDNNKVSIAGTDLFKNTFNVYCPKIETLEVYPNRNSLPYINLYGIPEVQTMFRGTFRYKGWCEIMDAFKTLGLTSPAEIDFSGFTYAKMMMRLVKEENAKEIKEKVAKYLKIKTDSKIIEAMDYLGLFEDLPMQRKKDSCFEIISDLMIEKMMLAAEERDMSVMQHLFLVQYDDGKQEMIRAGLLEYGMENGETSIARTVALPAACAVSLILDGEISISGVHVPVLPEIYNPIMTELESLGIEFIEQYGLAISTNNVPL